MLSIRVGKWWVVRWLVWSLQWILPTRWKRALAFRARLAVMRSRHHELVTKNEMVQQLPRMQVTITSKRRPFRMAPIIRSEVETGLVVLRILERT